MRVIFMGTPEIAAGVLKSIIASEHEVIAVVTQPDRPNARGNEIIFSDVKKVALEHDIPVYQPVKASDETFVEELRRLNPDIIVVTAFGQILRENILNLPPYGCVNVHASLLPKYRGASPIQWAVINGEEETGITIMYMDKGIDTGDIILERTLKLAPDETAGSLHDRLAEMGGPVLLEAMKQIEDGSVQRIKQNEEDATYVKMLKKSMGELDFTWDAERLERFIRGMIPWPGAYTFLNGKMLKLYKTEVSDRIYSGWDTVPGRIFADDENNLYIETGDRSLKIIELQLEGKKRMPAADFLRGYKLSDGAVCGKSGEA